MTEKMLPTRSRTPTGGEGSSPGARDYIGLSSSGTGGSSARRSRRGGAAPPAKGGVQPGQVSTLTGGRSPIATADTGHRGDGIGRPVRPVSFLLARFAHDEAPAEASGQPAAALSTSPRGMNPARFSPRVTQGRPWNTCRTRSSIK